MLKTKSVEDSIPELTIEERRQKAKAYLRAYKKNVASKGSSVMVGFGKDLPPDSLTMQIQPTNIVSIDTNLGGGLPVGGAFTVAGSESVGKTTFGMVVAAALQRIGKIVAWVDAEHTYEKTWAEKQGINTDELLLVQAETLEDALNFTVDTIRQNLVDFVIFDSIDAAIARQSLATKKGKERDLDNDDIALKARQFSRFFPRILHSLRANGGGLMLIAQYRTSGIGTAFVNNFHISSGNARRFYDWLTLELRRGPKSTYLVDEDNGEPIGFPLWVNVKKSKVPGVREGKTFSTMFFHNLGFNPDYEKVKYGYDAGLITKVNAQAHSYVDTKGVEHKIKFGKEIKVINALVEAGLANDVWAKATGEDLQNENSTTK